MKKEDKKGIRGADGRFVKGKKIGRFKGARNVKTINRELALEEYRQQMLRMMKPIMVAQLQSAQGLCVVLRPKLVKNYKTKKLERSGELAQVKNPEEIIELLEATERGEKAEGEDYHIVWTRDPNVKAIKDIWEMVFGKPQESVKVEHRGRVLLLDDLNDDEEKPTKSKTGK